MKRILLATATAAAILVGGTAVWAQGGFGHGHGHGHGSGMMGGRFGMMCENREARMAGMVAYAEKRLQITDAQRPAWNKLVQTVQQSSGPIDQLCAQLATAQPPQTLPERLQRMETMVQARVDQLKQVRPAIEEFYNTTLTPEQKKIADEMMQHGPGRRS